MSEPFRWEGQRIKEAGAEFSECKAYRYALWRIWQPKGPAMMMVGLNPSTADETKNDPTIRRCIAFAKREGFAGLYMLNLFALRSTDPANLKKWASPIGPKNDEALQYYSTKCQRIVAAWGSHPMVKVRWEHVCNAMGRQIDCFGITKEGFPRHPLYLRSDTPLVRFYSPGLVGGRIRE